MNMPIDDSILRAAFERFLTRLRGQSAMTEEGWAANVATMRNVFEDYRTRDHVQVLATPKFLELRSRTAYVGYAGDQATVLECAPAAPDDILGAAVVETLAASRQMMLDYLDGRLHPLEHVAGAACYRSHLDQLCARHGFKTPAALLKVSRGLSITRDHVRGTLVFLPMQRVRADYFAGLGPEATIELPQSAAAAEVGQALRHALARCQ